MAFYKRQSVLSTEFVQAEVRTERDGAQYDPTGDHVALAFTPVTGEPSSGDWQGGQWETETAGPLATYLASCLVGPAGTIALAKGRYTVWVRISDSPEVPIIPAGILDIY